MNTPILDVQGTAPFHWVWIPLKRAADINRRVLAEDVDPDYTFRYINIAAVHGDGSLGELAEVRFADAPSRARRVVEPGDVVVSTVRTYLRAIAQVSLADEHRIASTGFAVLSARSEIDPRFLYWWARSTVFIEEVVARSVGVGYPTVAPEELGLVPTPIPPRSDQEAIAEFLDRETVHIDALIARKRRLRGLLRERRQSATGRILLASGTYRSTAEHGGGPSRLGDEVTMLSLRQAGVTADTGPFGTQFAASEYAVGGIPMVNPTHIQDGRIEPTEDSALPVSVAQRLARYALRMGDIVLGRKGDVGRSALVGMREEGWIAGSDSIILRTASSRLSPRYLVNLLHLDVIKQQLEAWSTGATLANVNESILLAMRVPVPSLSEQERRAAQAEARAAQLGRLDGKVQDQLRLLEEHRQALITAAVMGQIDMPE